MIRPLLAFALLTACTTTPPPAQPFAPLNTFRAENGRKPLNPAPQLDAAARAHARDLTANGLFSHTGSDGSSPGDRITAQGYTFCFAAENLAQGHAEESGALRSWANSPGHRRNMLSRKAQAYGYHRTPENLYVLVFAARCK